MIAGTVNARREAVVGLRLRGSTGAVADVDAVVDTGFSGYLTLPMAQVTALGLAQHSVGGAVLADGSVRQFVIYEADVWWGGSWRTVLVSAVGGEVLAGMRLIAGHELCVEAVSGGSVSIAPLP